MAEDFYKTLGVNRDASEEDVQTAYREMARKYHPDLNPDDATAKEKFQQVQRAYEVLSDSNKREMYDRYGSSFESMGGFPGGGGPGRPGGPGGGTSWHTTGGTPNDIDLEEFLKDRFGGAPGDGGGFADMFRQFTRGAGTKQQTRKVQGQNLKHTLEIPFQTAVLGGDARISVQRHSGKVESIDVRIPTGIGDGKKIRLRGQGEPSPSGGAPGDILITVRVAAHPHFRRRGDNLEVTVPITLKEAVVGATIDLPTPKGTISLKVPPCTSSGKKLRVRGFGVADKGDLFAEVEIVLPDQISDETVAAIEQLNIGPDDPRADLRW